MNNPRPVPPPQGAVGQTMAPAGGAPGMGMAMEDGEGLNLGRIVDTLFEERWLILVVAGIATAIGLFLAVVAKPYYDASLTIQVEDNANPAASMLGELAGGDMFGGKSAVAAEMEIIRSRMVVKKAVDNLNVDILVEPKRFPVVGDFIARRSSGLSEPGFFGLGGYAWGRESLDIRRFETAPALVGGQFQLVAGPQGRYLLTMPDGTQLAGVAGKPQAWNTPAGAVRLYLATINAKAGAQFTVWRADRTAVAQELQRNLQIAEKGRQSGVMQVSLTGPEPASTAATLNEIGRQYVLQNVERKSQEAGATLAFLDGQLPKLKQELDAAESAFNQFRQSSGTVDLPEEAKTALQQSAAAQQRIAELAQQREQLVARLTPAHPSVVAVDGQLRAAREQVARLTASIRALPKVEQDFLRLTRDVQVKTELYQQLLNSAQQLQVVRASKVGNVRLLDEALVPGIPSKPNRTRMVLLAALLGMAAGIGLAFLKRSMRSGIQDADEIERALGMTVYASVPFSTEQQKLAPQLRGNLGQHLLLAGTKDADPAIESLRSLRTALQFAMLDAHNNVLMISGPTPNLGKSFVSANFAQVLASGGKRVLLIDADLRKGYLNQYFGLERQNGLSEVISGALAPNDAIRREVLPGLDFMTTGEMPPNPSELLLNPRLRQVLDDLSMEYDAVVVDSPPVLVVSDATVLGTQAGTVFMVAREGMTTLGELDDSQRRFQQSGTNVKGIIFNGVRPRLSSYYGYGYKYGYRYGYGYKYGYSRNSYGPYTGE